MRPGEQKEFAIFADYTWVQLDVCQHRFSECKAQNAKYAHISYVWKWMRGSAKGSIYGGRDSLSFCSYLHNLLSIFHTIAPALLELTIVAVTFQISERYRIFFINWMFFTIDYEALTNISKGTLLSLPQPVFPLSQFVKYYPQIFKYLWHSKLLLTCLNFENKRSYAHMFCI